MPSFSVRIIFQWDHFPNQFARNLYEERITLWNAPNFDEAIRLAEIEADAYAKDKIKCLGLLQAFELCDEVLAHGIEVYSLLRESDLEPDEYLTSFFDTGKEHNT